MATSTISNNLNDATLPDFTVTATLMPGTGFRISNSTEVLRQVSTTCVAGMWELALERQANITPEDSWWSVEEDIPEANGGRRVWPVSVGSSNATLYGSLVSPSQNPAMAMYLTQAAGDARYLQTGAYIPTALDGIQFVSKAGSDDNTGLAWGQAKLTLAAAYTALPAAGGRIYVGWGIFTESEWDITKPVWVQGIGYWSYQTGAFGSANWNNTSFYGGTVIKSTATSGHGIFFNVGNFPGGLQDLMVLGPGSGTSNGVSITDANAIAINNVQSCNFKTTWNFGNVEDCDFHNLYARGYLTGFSLANATNQNNFYNTRCEFGTTTSILVTDNSHLNMFYGGLIQALVAGCNGIVCDGVSGTHDNHFDAFWFENPNGPGKSVWFKSGSQGCSLTRSFLSANEVVQIDGPNSVIGPNGWGGGGTLNISGLGTKNYGQWGSPTITRTDAGSFHVNNDGSATAGPRGSGEDSFYFHNNEDTLNDEWGPVWSTLNRQRARIRAISKVAGNNTGALRFDVGDGADGWITVVTLEGTVATVAKLLTTMASATGGAGLRLPHGAAPTSPVNGDVWTTTAGLFVRVNGSTVGPLS